MVDKSHNNEAPPRRESDGTIPGLTVSHAVGGTRQQPTNLMPPPPEEPPGAGASAPTPPPRGNGERKGQTLPAEWESSTDRVSGRTYYYNTVTKETTWEAPRLVGGSGVDQSMDSLSLGEDRKMNDSTMPPPAARAPRPGRSPPTTAPPAATTTATTKATSASKAVPPPRHKKRFGLADWNLLVRSATDLALRRGAPLRPIKWREIRQHASRHDGWVVLRGKVYFLSPYLAYHPGGEAILAKCLGKDATALYDKYHSWVNLEALIGTLQIGYLDTSRDGDEDEDGEDDDRDAAKGFDLPGALRRDQRGR